MSYIHMEHAFLMFLDHTQRRSTVGRTPLDEWSARRRDHYLTKHDTHNRQISMPPVGFEPTISAGQRPQTARLRSRGHWDRPVFSSRIQKISALLKNLIMRFLESSRAVVPGEYRTQHSCWTNVYQQVGRRSLPIRKHLSPKLRLLLSFLI